jgi:predicted N-acetyltransferase YhbS
VPVKDNTMNNIAIRNEHATERAISENLVREAFWNLFKPGCDEHLILHKARSHPAFVKELSLVAVESGAVLGCIATTRANVVETETGLSREVLCPGPLAVHPDHQKRGIGSILVQATLAKARELGFSGAFLYGNPSFYQRFGFENASRWGVTTPQGMNFDAFMGVELVSGGLVGVKGKLDTGDLFEVDPAELERFDAGFEPKEKTSPKVTLHL